MKLVSYSLKTFCHLCFKRRLVQVRALSHINNSLKCFHTLTREIDKPAKVADCARAVEELIFRERKISTVHKTIVKNQFE